MPFTHYPLPFNFFLFIYPFTVDGWSNKLKRCPHGIVANMLDRDIAVREFELPLHYYVLFWTNASWERHEPPYPSQL